VTYGGVLRGKVRRKNVDPHISGFEGQGTLKFFCLIETYRPHNRTKNWTLELKGD